MPTDVLKLTYKDFPDKLAETGVDTRSSNKQIHEVAREWPAQGQALQQNCVTARSVYSDNTF